MYVTINNVIGEKRIDLAYPIKNFDSSKSTKPWTIEMKSGNREIMEGTTYARRELADFL